MSRNRPTGGKAGSGGPSGISGGGRQLSQRVKTAKRRKPGSTRWLHRQLNDPYVAQAKGLGYRSRAAFKIIEIDEKIGLFRRGQSVIDLGAAPGGWTQIAVEATGSAPNAPCVAALDILEMEALPGAHVLQADFMADAALELLAGAMPDPADLVLSDMSPATIGHRATDHLRIMALSEAAADFALGALKPGGGFVCKVFQGGAERDLLQILNRAFEKVRHFKPPASRPESPETYVIATGFRGPPD